MPSVQWYELCTVKSIWRNKAESSLGYCDVLFYLLNTLFINLECKVKHLSITQNSCFCSKLFDSHSNKQIAYITNIVEKMP